MSRIEPDGQVSKPTQADEDHFEMSVRAANMVGDGTLKIYMNLDLLMRIFVNRLELVKV